MLQSLQELRSLGVDVYFEQENMRLSGQQIQALLAAYCAFAQAESEKISADNCWMMFLYQKLLQLPLILLLLPRKQVFHKCFLK